MSYTQPAPTPPDHRRDRHPPKRPPRLRGPVLPVVLFVVYLVLLAWTVVWKLEVPHIGGGALRHIKLVPFAASGADGASAPLEVLANLLLFVPFGVYLGLLAPSWPWWKDAGAVAGTSLTLEVAQYTLAVGSSDVTDLVVNTTGGLTGLALLVLARRRLHARTTTVVTRVCVAGTGVALLTSGVFFASPLHYSHREAPPGPRPSLSPKHVSAGPAPVASREPQRASSRPELREGALRPEGLRRAEVRG